MPLVAESGYKTAIPNGHLETVLPYLRRRRRLPYARRRILTADQDFLDLDWLYNGAEQAVVVTHDVEGSSQSPHVLSAAAALVAGGWDVLCWNMRGCSGEPNALPTWYHAGQTDDLARVFSHALFRKRYQRIALVGFGLGGALTLNFLGQQGEALSALIHGAVVFSTPCDLRSWATQMTRPVNRLYARYLLRSLRRKIGSKAETFPEFFAELPLDGLHSWSEFEQRVTAPLHGFGTAEEYWRACSPKQVLGSIRVPTLVVNAANDPFLGEECFPVEEARTSEFLSLEMPRRGGHAAFPGSGRAWAARRALSFLRLVSQPPDTSSSCGDNATAAVENA